MSGKPQVFRPGVRVSSTNLNKLDTPTVVGGHGINIQHTRERIAVSLSKSIKGTGDFRVVNDSGLDIISRQPVAIINANYGYDDTAATGKVVEVRTPTSADLDKPILITTTGVPDGGGGYADLYNMIAARTESGVSIGDRLDVEADSDQLHPATDGRFQVAWVGTDITLVIWSPTGAADASFPETVPMLRDATDYASDYDDNPLIHDIEGYMIRPTGCCTSNVQITAKADYHAIDFSFQSGFGLGGYGPHFNLDPSDDTLQIVDGSGTGNVDVRDVCSMTQTSDPFNGGTTNMYWQGIVGEYSYNTGFDVPPTETFSYEGSESIFASITAVDQTNDFFTVTGDVSGLTGVFLVVNSTGNNDEYNVASVSGQDVYVVEEIPDATADGEIIQEGDLYLDTIDGLDIARTFQSANYHCKYSEGLEKMILGYEVSHSQQNLTVRIVTDISAIGMLMAPIPLSKVPKNCTFVYLYSENTIAFVTRDSAGDFWRGFLTGSSSSRTADDYAWYSMAMVQGNNDEYYPAPARKISTVCPVVTTYT